MGAETVEIKCGNNICSVAFLPDGKDLVCGGWEGKTRRWKAESGREVGVAMDAGSCVLNLAVSPNGKWVVSGTNSGRVTVWNAETHAKATEIDTHAKSVYAVDVSPDSRHIATESDEKAVCVWSISTGERLFGPWKHDGSIAGIKYSPNGALIATASLERDSIRIYDSKDGRLLVPDIRVGVSAYLNQSFTWAADSTQLIVLSGGGNIKYLDVTTGRVGSQWAIHSNDKPRCIALANNGKFVATSANSSISFWDTTTYKQIGDVLQYGGSVRTMAISPSIDHLASGGDDQKITLRSLRDVLPESYLVETIEDADIKKTNEPLLLDKVRVQEENPVLNLNNPSSATDSAVASRVEIDVQSDTHCIDFLADGMLITSSGPEGKVRLWRAEDGHEVGTAMDAGDFVLDLVVSRDGKWVVSGTRSGLVRVWNAQSQEKVGDIKGHEKPVGSVDISPDGTRIATGSDDSTACVWSIASGERLLGPLKHDGKLAAVKYSSSGEFVATATCSHKSVRVYKSRDGSLMADINVRVGSHMNESLAWSRHNEQLFVLSKHGIIHCLDAATGGAHSEWSTHDSDKAWWCIDLASNGTFVAASTNSLVSFWDITTHKQIGSLQCGSTVFSMILSPNSERLVTCEDDKKITIRKVADIIPESYLVGSDSREREIRHVEGANTGIERPYEPRKESSESNRNRLSASTTGNDHQTGKKRIEMDGRNIIWSVEFLAHGTYIVSGGLEGKVRRWRAEDGREVGTEMNAGGQVFDLAGSQDGKWVVSGTHNGLVKVWNAESHEKVSEIHGHAKPVGAVDISPDATRIATGSDDSTACVWSLASGERLLGPLQHDGRLAAVRHSPNGDFIATATCSHESVRVYKSLDGSLIADFQVRVGSYLNQSLAWSLDSKQLYALTKYGNIHCVDVATGTTRSKWSIQDGDKPRCISLAANGTFIAASVNSSVTFWDSTTHKQIGVALQYDDTISSMLISPNNEHLVSGGDDKKISLQDLRGILPESYFIRIDIDKINKSASANVRARESNGDHSPIPTGVFPQTGTKIIVMDGRNSIRSVAFLVDGTHIVSGGSEGKLRYWRVEDGREVGTTIDAGGRILNSAVSRDGKWIVSGAENGRVIVWSAESHEQVGEIKGHAKPVGAVDISPDATRIVTGSDDSTACVWSILSGERLLDPLKHDHALVAVKYSPNGDLIATATWSRKSVRIYKNQDGSLLFDLPISVNSVLNQSIAWSIDGEQLFALSKFGCIHCLDVATGTTHSEWAIHSNDKPRCIALARNGTFIAASANSSISFWDPTTHQQIGDVLQCGDAVRSVAISIDNGQLVSGGDDKKITLRSLRELLPQFYFVDTDPREPEIRRMRKEKTELEKTNESLRALLRAHEQKHECEALYSEDRAKDAADSLCKFVDSASDEVKTDGIIMDWVSEFTKRCVVKLGDMGDAASSAGKHDDAIAAYSTALSISSPKDVLVKWAKTTLAHGSVDRALSAATKFKFSKFTIRQAICDVLEGADRVTDAIEVLETMATELGKDPRMHEEHGQWMLNSQQRYSERIEKLGDAAMGSREYAEAVEQYTTVLSRKPMNIAQILTKRSSARSSIGLWEEALDDADEAIKLDPSYHRGYESRHAALHGKERYTEAATAFKKMLSILEQSPDMQIRKLRCQYVDASATIRRVVQQTVRDMPRVLIDTTSGRLLDRTQQALAFEELPIYSELVSSMTTQLDLGRIRREVKEYYRYVMLSHKWEHNEPLLQKVENISVYELEASPENTKLQLFCSIVRSLGFKWAWSDTCCVDKTNHVVLQESLVAMFTWYHGSSLTIVYLRGVLSQFGKPGDLRQSIWNTRAWTYQEYVASKVVQFYTEDWKPYLGLDMFNHRESPAIVSEMEQATGVSAQKLVTLRPGLDRVREKLYLASARQTTLVEDAAYSLFGIFNVAITVICGEGNRAVGRLLEHIVTGSGDVTILAWTGHSGRYNSSLPVDLTVYNEPHAPHVPLPIDSVDMTNLIDALRASFPDSVLAEMLYDRLNGLPLPSLAASRLKLSGICFPVDELVPTSRSDSESNLQVYRATIPMLADIEIKTSEDLSGMNNLLLVHPWIRPLLDQEFSQGAFAFDKTTRALRFLACLMQPFGALLFAPLSRVEYKRVAADSPIVVQVCKEVSLTALMDNIRTIDIQ